MYLKGISSTLCGGLVLLLTGCAMHTASTDWNGLVGPDGQPNYYKSTSKVAVKLGIIIPFIGDLSVDGLIDDLTEDIAKEEGNKIRIVQAGSENYWYGFPPFTWIVTPCISTVAAQYEPSEATHLIEQEKIRAKEESWQKYNPMNL
ncbi:hypothetical protein P4C99_21065 [Pontiellaceae bacterium B1224]|nr:hypothetical protein [Pontiellaceae bacterium B1224]